MFFDYHIHCSHSQDCSVPMEQQILRAKELGITELCFTDHLELGLEQWGDREIDLVAYRAEFERLQELHPEIRLKLGIEAGISCPSHLFPRLKAMMSSMPFDFVIASAHTMDGKSVLNAFEFKARGLAQVCREYIPSILKRLKELDKDSWNCVGHIDFPLKGALRRGIPNARYSYSFAPDEMDELFRYITEQGKCLELNTSPRALLADSSAYCPDWLKRYAQLGGEYITIGSDSHRLENTGAFFSEALELARNAGIRYLATFENMRPIFHALDRI